MAHVPLEFPPKEHCAVLTSACKELPYVLASTFLTVPWLAIRIRKADSWQDPGTVRFNPPLDTGIPTQRVDIFS